MCEDSVSVGSRFLERGAWPGGRQSRGKKEKVACFVIPETSSKPGKGGLSSAESELQMGIFIPDFYSSSLA